MNSPLKTSEWFAEAKRLHRATDPPKGIDLKQWQREQHAKLVDKSYPEIANELWQHGIAHNNPFLARWLMECCGFSRLTAHKMKRKLKHLSPLILLAREAPDESEIEDDD
jgi:hypothetical protein